jgi:hypothetical protein
MDESLLNKLLHRAHLPIPGDSSFLSSMEANRSIETVVIHHHRLAFYYWVRWTTSNWTTSLPNGLAPDLVTVDWHDDVGCDADCTRHDTRRIVCFLSRGDRRRMSRLVLILEINQRHFGPETGVEGDCRQV